MPGSSGTFLVKKPNLKSGTETHPGGKKSAGGSVSAGSDDARKKGAVGVGTPDASQTTASSTSSYLVFQVGMLSHFLNQWRSITSDRFVLNMVQGHYLLLRPCPPLFHNFWQFSVKVTAAHHPIIQKEEDELLSKGANEPSSGGAGFYTNVFVVHKCTGGLWPIPKHKLFNHSLCILF